MSPKRLGPLRAPRRHRAEIEALILDLLSRSNRPPSAYDLAGMACAQGVRLVAPQVYRTLGRLIDEGRVARIETLNAYVLRDEKDIRASLICKECEAAELKPSTGNAGREFSLERAAEVATAVAAFNSIYLQHQAHRDVFTRLDYLLKLGEAPGPKPAVRLTGASFAGKSTALAEYRRILEKRGVITSTRKTVVYVSLDRACTTKRLIASCLEAFGEEYPNNAVESVLRRRLYRCIERFETKMMQIDEVQHMDFRSTNRDNATDMLKRLLDDGVVTLVLAGNEDARSFLRSNIQLSNRMITPCDLNRLDREDEGEAAVFATFMQRLDDKIVEAGLMPSRSNLAERRTLLCIHEVSDGLLGRAKTLVRVALEHALNRGASAIEPFDLASATRDWAVPLKVASYNPFSKGVRLSASTGVANV